MRRRMEFRRGPTASAALAIGLGVMMLVVLLPAPASAGATTIEFEGVFYSCSSTPPTSVRLDGNVLHLRGITNHNQWVTGNPYVDGFLDNVVNVDVNLLTGTGVGHARAVLVPDAFDGTWDLTTTVNIDPAGPTAHGVGHGTGQLHGMTIRFTNSGQVSIDPVDNPCSNNPVATLLSGEVIVPASKS